MAAFKYITDPVRSKYLADDTDYDMKVRVFERDAIGLIAGNPDVTFDIYLPPYSILQWVAMRDASPATLESVYDFSGYFCRRLAAFPNVRLHDFRAVSEVTHDLNNYADVIHHSPDVDLKVLSWLAEGKYLVDRAAPVVVARPAQGAGLGVSNRWYREVAARSLTMESEFRIQAGS